MTITEFIKELEKIKAEYGDLDVGMVSAYTCDVNFEVVVCKSVCYKNMPEKIEPDTELEETPYCEIYGAKVKEKKDDLVELIEYLEKHYAIQQSINSKGEYDHLVKRYKQVINYLYELQEARKTFKRTSEIINMWDD